MKAMVCKGVNDYGVEEVTLDPPKAGELKIKMKATGVCHSDLSVLNGKLPLPTPCVVGHEGAGIVDEVGEGVTGFGAAIELFDWIEKVTVSDIKAWIVNHLDSAILPIELIQVDSGLLAD